MGEAGVERIIFLSAALELVAQALGSSSIAEQRLRAWLAEEQVRWRCTLSKGKTDLTGWEALPTSAVARFGKYWRDWLEVYWPENRARGKSLNGAPEVYLIEVVEADVLAQLPRMPPSSKESEMERPKGPPVDRVLSVLPEIYPPGIERPKGPQADRVLSVLPEIYQPHGVPPLGVLIQTVTRAVGKKLESESRANGLGDPGRDVVRRCVEYFRALQP